MALFTITTELLIDGVWTDISSDVRQADGVQITRGIADEASTADPSSCTLTLNNRDGKYSPRNPMSPYYGLIGRNTQIRVKANGNIRFHGEVTTWPQRWDKSGSDVWVPLQAYGITRRLGQGDAPLRSVMYRGITALDSVVAYWPCEDGEDATEFASALPGHPPMYPRGTVEMATFEGFKASEPLPTSGGVRWIGSVPTYTVTGETQVNFLMHVPTGGASFTKTICRIRTTGSAPRWELDLTPAGSLVLRAFDVDDVLLFSSGVTFDVNGRMLRVTIELEQVGSNVDWSIGTLEVGELFGTSDGGTLASRTVGRVVRVGMNVAGSDLTDTVLGHIVVRNELGPDTATAGLELRAFDGEWAGTRLLRLCTEEGFTISFRGALQDTVDMGPQLPGTLLELLAECAVADGGILHELHDLVGLRYRNRVSMYAQTAALTLDYASGAVFSIEPTEDDDATRNDITVTRVNGSSARAQLETGPLSVNAPPDGVGRYDDGVTISIERDEELRDQASWRLHLGTVDEARYPMIGVNLAHSAFTSDAVLMQDAIDLNIGDRIVITNAPSDTTGPDDVQQIVQGLTETLGQYEWLIDMNCTPASPWDVGVWDDSSGPGEARYSSDGTTTTQALTTTGTVVPIDTPTGPLWSDVDAPFDIVVGGERMTVNAVATNIPNASFESNGEWTVMGPDTTVAQNSFEPLHGTYAALITIDGTPTSGFNGVQLSGAEVTAGQWLAVSVPVRPDGATPVESARVRIHWMDAAGVQISTDTTARTNLSAFTYNTLTHSALAPANTASALVSLFFASTASDVPLANSTGRTDGWAVVAAATQADAVALAGAGYGQQVMAVTRSVNSIVKAHSSGADLALFKPAVYAL